MELSQSPPGLPHQHRMAPFSKILGAMLDAQVALEEDGLAPDLVDQIMANAIAHSLAVVAVNMNLSGPDLAEVFLQYCKLVKEAQHDMPGVARH